MRVKYLGYSAFKIILTIAVIGVLAVVSVWAYSIWDLLQAEKSRKRTEIVATAAPGSAAEPSPAEGRPAIAVGVPGEIGYGDIQNLLRSLASEQQSLIVDDENRFQQFVQSESDMRSMLKAATDNNMQNNEQLRFMMNRAAERVLVEAYLNQLIRLNTVEGFPSEEQVREFYNNNKERFNVPERVHISQIFWAIPRDGDAKRAAEIEASAREIVKSLRQGKLEFADAAARHSEHAASRSTGGYMGLVKVTDLLPEVRAKLMSMKVGAISDPVRTDTGFHVINRGVLVPSREMPFAEASDQARRLFINEYASQLRAALVEKARETYPYPVDDEIREQWRTKLREGLPAVAASPE